MYKCSTKKCFKKYKIFIHDNRMRANKYVKLYNVEMHVLNK